MQIPVLSGPSYNFYQKYANKSTTLVYTHIIKTTSYKACEQMNKDNETKAIVYKDSTLIHTRANISCLTICLPLPFLLGRLSIKSLVHGYRLVVLVSSPCGFPKTYDYSR